MNKKTWVTPAMVKFGTVEDITQQTRGTANCKNVPGGVGAPITQPNGTIKLCGFQDTVNFDAGALGS